MEYFCFLCKKFPVDPLKCKACSIVFCNKCLLKLIAKERMNDCPSCELSADNIEPFNLKKHSNEPMKPADIVEIAKDEHPFRQPLQRIMGG